MRNRDLAYWKRQNTPSISREKVFKILSNEGNFRWASMMNYDRYPWRIIAAEFGIENPTQADGRLFHDVFHEIAENKEQD